MISKKTTFIVGCFLLCLCVEIQTKADVTSIPAPCLKTPEMQSPRLDLQACNYVFPEQSVKNKSKLIDNFMSDFKTQIDCFYQGYVLKPESKSCSGGISMSNGSNQKTPVCSITDGESELNHLKESCGSPDSLNGQWEHSQMLGLWVQSVKFFRNQVMMEEIVKTNSLKIHSRCLAEAKHYLEVSQEAKKISDTLVQGGSISVPPQVYSGEINFCSSDTNPSPVSGVPKGSACYLSISRDNRVLMFADIAECEVWARIDEFMVDYAQNHSKQIVQMVSECSSAATTYGKKVGKEKLSESAGIAAGVRFFKDCYRPKIKKFFEDVVNQTIPGKFQSRNDGVNFGENYFIFAIGALARLKRSKSKKKSSSVLRAFSYCIFFNISILVLSGCGDDDDDPGPVPSASPRLAFTCLQRPISVGDKSVPNEKEKICCEPGADQLFSETKAGVNQDPKTCEICNPLTCSPKEKATLGALAAGQNAEAANTQAAKLVSDSPTTAPTGTGSTEGLKLAATASDAPVSSKKPDEKKGSPDKVSTSTSGVSGNGGSISAGGAGSNTGGLGNSNALGSASAPTGQTSNSANSDSSTNVYVSGGGGFTGSEGGGRRNFTLSGGDHEGTKVEFSRQGEDTKAVSVDDPEDYFTRIGLEDNIFKIVHARYQRTGTSWVKESLK